MELHVHVHVHPKNLAGIRAILAGSGDGQTIELNDDLGNGRLFWRGKHQSIQMPIPMEWLTDPAKVHEVQESARAFAKSLLAAQPPDCGK